MLAHVCEYTLSCLSSWSYLVWSCLLLVFQFPKARCYICAIMPSRILYDAHIGAIVPARIEEFSVLAWAKWYPCSSQDLQHTCIHTRVLETLALWSQFLCLLKALCAPPAWMSWMLLASLFFSLCFPFLNMVCSRLSLIVVINTHALSHMRDRCMFEGFLERV
jgi:hypothetical protein